MVDTEYLTLAEVAKLLRVNKVTIRRRIRDGMLPAYRVAGSQAIRIRREDADRLLTRMGTADPLPVADALSQPCPRCGANVGERCRNLRTADVRPTTIPHVDRRWHRAG